MLPTPDNYSVWPSVIPANKKVEMTITGNEKAFVFAEGVAYQLKIIHVSADEDSYYTPTKYDLLTVEAHDGILRFEYVFPGEMEHMIILSRDGKEIQKMIVYSLYEDWYALTPYKGDFHAHSFRSDGKRDPAALAGHFREQGYDFFALTDHNRFYPGQEIDETFAGVHMGLTRVLGEEVHAPSISVHVVHVGGKRSVTEFYINNREAYEKEAEAYIAALPEHIPQDYRERYGKTMWAVDKIHEAGGLAIFPHPYWRPGSTYMDNVDIPLTHLLLKSGKFDAYELLGCMGQVGANLSLAMWNDLRAEGIQIPVVGSSDVHSISGDNLGNTFPHLFTICLATANENDAIVKAVKNSRTIPVEATGDEYNRHYRCYGTLRQTAYGQFLMKHYFPKLQRLAQGEGVAMRAYAMEEAPAVMIEANAAMVEDFRLRFFGRKEAKLPSTAMLAWEEKWREVQRNGPRTKGSDAYSDEIRYQI